MLPNHYMKEALYRLAQVTIAMVGVVCFYGGSGLFLIIQVQVPSLACFRH